MYITREKVIKIGLLATIFAVSVVILSIILMGVNQFKLGSQLASVNQVANLSHLLVRQQAKLFSLLLVKNNNTEELIEALDTFAKEKFVIDANLYSASGNLIAQSYNAHPFNPQSDKKEGNRTQQIVEPIFAQQDLIGFLRVTFDAEYGQTTKSKVDQHFHQLYGELIILFLAGGLLVSSLYHFFRKRPLTNHLPIKSNMHSKRSQSHRFHSRRRAFQRK